MIADLAKTEKHCQDLGVAICSYSFANKLIDPSPRLALDDHIKRPLLLAKLQLHHADSLLGQGNKRLPGQDVGFQASHEAATEDGLNTSALYILRCVPRDSLPRRELTTLRVLQEGEDGEYIVYCVLDRSSGETPCDLGAQFLAGDGGSRAPVADHV